MVKGRLVMALDFGKKKGAPEVHGAESHLTTDGKWRVVKFGPTYSNSYEITDFDDGGLKWLQEHQPQGASDG